MSDKNQLFLYIENNFADKEIDWKLFGLAIETIETLETMAIINRFTWKSFIKSQIIIN